MSLEYVSSIKAMAKITAAAAAGGAFPITPFNAGFLSATHAATGIWVLTFDNPVDPVRSVAVGSGSTGTDSTVICLISADGTTCTVTCNQAGAASDADNFQVIVFAGPNSP
jgi:hypothetical protein